MNHPEDRLHETVWAVLKYALPADAVAISHENRKNGLREGLRRKKRGCLPGWPDLQILWARRCILIELKATTGRVSEAQKEMHARLERAGVGVAVCRSVPDVLAYLTACGIPLKATVAA